MWGKIASFAVALLNSDAVRSVAWKYFLKTVITVLVPLAVFTTVNWVLGEMVDWMITKIDSLQPTISNSAVSVSGMFGYVFVQIGGDVLLSMLISVVGIKMTLRAIPFLRTV